MKVSHRKNINRRKEKFGYDSNSLIGLNMTGILMNMNKLKFLKIFENIKICFSAAALQQADAQKDVFEEE